MTKTVLTEGVSQIAQTIIQSFSEAEKSLTVLVDASMQPTISLPHITYQPIDWMDAEEWKYQLRDTDNIIFNVHTKMFNSSLWHGRRSDLRRLISKFVNLCHSADIIELKIKKEQPVFENATYYELPKSYFYSNCNVHTEAASSLQSMNVESQDSVSKLLVDYAKYLQKMTLGLIEVRGLPQNYNIYAKGLKRPLIAMQPESMDIIDGIRLRILPEGLLSKKVSHSLMSFFFIKISRTELQTFLYRFESSLPWWLYMGPQALIHDIVMAGFKRG